MSFDGTAQGANIVHIDESRVGEHEKERVHRLDSESSREKLAKLKEFWYEARTLHADNRYEQSLDADFYDGLQWTEEDAQALRDRGQAPLVFNQIATFVNWIIGTERRTRFEASVLPREDEDQEPSESARKLLKFLSDANKAQFHRSEAFEDSVKVGIGWLEDGVRDRHYGEPVFTRSESWKYMWLDPLSKEWDLSDARYLFRVKYVDLDVAKAMFPERKAVLERSSKHVGIIDEENEDIYFMPSVYQGQGIYTAPSYFDDTFHIGNRRQRVRLFEVWYREPENRSVCHCDYDEDTPAPIKSALKNIDGRFVDEIEGDLEPLINRGYIETNAVMSMQMRVAVFCNEGLLEDAPSTYAHNRFPFTPVWCYRRSRDNMPYGQIRNMRDPQEDLNKRRSKALYIMSTKGMITDEDAFEDWDEVEEQIARPNFLLKKKAGAEVELHMDNRMAEQHVQLMTADQEFIEHTAGVTKENLGAVTNATSGRAILARQNQGTVVTAMIFDNLRRAVQHQGEIQLSLIKQNYTRRKVFRIINEDGLAHFERINYAENGVFHNDISALNADFVVDTQDYRETVRAAMFEQLQEMVAQLPPEVGFRLLDLVFELSDLPQKSKLIRRIRELNGQVDDSDPIAINEKRAREAEQAERDQLEADAKVAIDQSRARLMDAQAEAKRTDALNKAQQTAESLVRIPQTAPVTDSLSQSTKR